MFSKKSKIKKNSFKNKKFIRVWAILLHVGIVFAILASAGFSHAAAGINKQINYQGKLTDGGGVAVDNGSYDMKISLYTAASGGTPVWTARGTTGAPAARTVALDKGIFSIMLGDTVGGDNPISIDFSQDTYYLGITVGLDAEMTPRKRIGSVPQAFNANNLVGDGYVNISGVPTGTGVGQGTVYVNPAAATAGYTLLGLAVGGVQQFKVDAQGNVSMAGTINSQTISAAANFTGTLAFATLGATNTATLLCRNSSNQLAGCNTIGVTQGGTGTATQFAQGSIVFAGASGVYSQDNSNFFWDNTTKRLGLGTATPLAKLGIYATGAEGGIYVRTDGTGNLLTLNGSGTDILTVSPVQASFNVPTSFTSVGDISLAYDLVFTNQTISNIKTSSPFTIEVGELFESNDLTLRTFNAGGIVLDSPGGLTSMQAQTWGLATSTSALNIANGLINIDTTNGRIGIGTTSPASVLDVVGVINSANGFRIGNVATSGNYLRGNGTDFVSSGIQAGDVPALNQNTTGSAATLATSRDLYGFSFNGSAGTVPGVNIITSGYGGTGTSTEFTQGSLVFAGANGIYSQDNTNLFWDNVNKRLGIGNASPTALLDIQNTNSKLLYAKRTSVFDSVQYNIVATGWTNITAEAGTSLGTVSGDVLDVNGDFLYTGKSQQYDSMYIDLGAGKSAGGTMVFEYSRGGGAWGALSVADGTANLTVDGTITFTPPGDWASDTVNGAGPYYWVRIGTSGGAFTTEPTVYLVVPNNGTPVSEIYANGNDILPSLVVDAKGNVGIGYSDTATYRLRVNGQIYSSTGFTGGSFSGSTGAFSGAITNTLATTGQTHVGGLILNGPAATALLPSQNSPIARFSSQAWDGTLTRINSMDIYVNPDSEPGYTKSRMAFKNTTVDGYADATELMNLTSNGALNVLGNAQRRDSVFDSVQRYVGGVYTDDTVTVSSFGVATGDVLDVIGNYVYIGKRDTFDSIYLDFATTKSAGGVLSFEYSTNGSTWTTLPSVADGTNSMANDGTISFTAPGDWATSTVNSVTGLYWVRIGIASGTFVTEPTLRWCLPDTSVIDNEVFANGEFDGNTKWTPSGDYAFTTDDYTFTYATGIGALTQAAADFNTPAKPNTWYRFRYVVGVAAPATTKVWIGNEFAAGDTYFSGSTTEVDVFFKSNSNPGDFVIRTTASATSGFQLTGVSLIEMTGGNVFASGMFTGGGTSGMKIDNLGNVGIGTINPNAKLTIAVPFAVNGNEGALVTGQVASTTLVGMYSVAEDVITGRAGLSFKTENDAGAFAERLRIAGNGNVGIGTASPYDALEVAGAISSSGGMAINTAQGPVTSMYYSAGGYGGIQAVDWGVAYKDLVLNEGGGNVGIGTMSPSALLSVGASSQFQINGSGQIVAGVWNGSAIGTQYGGTGINTSALTGIATVNAGTWSIASSLGLSQGGTGASDAAGARANLGLGSLSTLSSVNLASNVTGILPVANGGTGTSSQFTQGSLIFAGASGVYSQNNSNLFWDNTNNRLRIGGSSTPRFSLQVEGDAYIKNALVGVGGQGFADLGMGILYDRNELTNAYYRGSVTANITGAGSSSSLNLLTDASGSFGSINDIDVTTSQVIIQVTLPQNVFNYSAAVWQPFFQLRTAISSQNSYPRAVTVEVSDNGSTWYKPSNGAWDTASFQTASFNGLWMATAGTPNSPSNLPGSVWRYAKFTLSDFNVGSLYDDIWIAEVGIRHYAAPAARQFLSATGDTMYGGLTMSGANISLNGNWLSGDGGNEGIYVNNSGNVGIGTSSPGSRLSVSGGATVGATYASGYTAPTNGMFIEGNVSIGSSNSVYMFDVNGVSMFRDSLTVNGGIDIYTGNVGIGVGGVPAYHFQVTDEGTSTTRFGVQTGSNNIYAYGAVQTSWSDRNLKHDIVGQTDMLDKIMDLRPVTYKWNSDLNIDNQLHYGIIAQEIKQVFPSMVYTDQDGHLNVKRDELQFVLAKGIQEQQLIIGSQQSAIDNINLKTDTNISSTSELQISVDQQLSLIGSKFSSVESRILDIQTKSADQDLLIDTLEKSLTDAKATMETLQVQMDLIREQNQAVVDFSVALNIKSLIYKDAFGNLDLLDGKFAAAKIETGVLTIKIVDITKPMIGQATIKKIMIDENGDGIDDITGSDGRMIEIKTEAVSEDSKIFTSFVKNPGSSSWVEKVIDSETGNYRGFRIMVDQAVKDDTGVDWWIVESKK